MEHCINEQAVYLDGENGDDEYGGTTPKDALKTFEAAKARLSDTRNVIVITGTVTVADDDQTWSLTDFPESEVVRGAGFECALVEITGGTLTIDDITFDGNKDVAPADQPIILVHGGRLNMLSGGVTNNADYGISIIDDGEISGSTADISGGEIRGNILGGIYASGGATISGDAIITANGDMEDAYSTGGVAICGGSVTLSEGAEIYDNAAYANGGGIYVAGALTLSGGHVYENRSHNEEIGLSGQIHFACGTLNIAGDSVVAGEIYIANGDALTLAQSITDPNLVYMIGIKDAQSGDIVVRPDGINVHDAAEYIEHFTLSGTDLPYSLIAEGLDIAIGQAYYINGRSAEKGNGCAPYMGENGCGPFNDISDIEGLMDVPGRVVYVSGTVDVHGAHALRGAARLERYSEFAYDVLHIYDDGQLAVNGVEIRGPIYQGGELRLSGRVEICDIVVLGAPNHGIIVDDPMLNVVSPLKLNIEQPQLWYVFAEYPEDVSEAEVSKFDLSINQSRSDWDAEWRVLPDNVRTEQRENNPRHIILGAFYEIDASASYGGRISSNGRSTVAAHGNIAYTATPGRGGALRSILIDGAAQTSGSTYTFANVTGNHTIRAAFNPGGGAGTGFAEPPPQPARAVRRQPPFIAPSPAFSTPRSNHITVEKRWIGGYGRRPERAYVTLMRDGQAYGSPVTLSAQNRWRHTFNNLASEFSWSVDEVNVPSGYRKSVENNISNSQVVITNRHVMR